ncbi:hypothetical protein [Sulfitobacter sp.]|uniref:hypothetical protein n=1 Tax=Sulfitobacter sp. TaxID=1903071 RepID=UPI004058D66D
MRSLERMAVALNAWTWPGRRGRSGVRRISWTGELGRGTEGCGGRARIIRVAGRARDLFAIGREKLPGGENTHIVRDDAHRPCASLCV